mgnify:CR=1 FL=1
MYIILQDYKHLIVFCAVTKMKKAKNYTQFIQLSYQIYMHLSKGKFPCKLPWTDFHLATAASWINEHIEFLQLPPHICDWLPGHGLLHSFSSFCSPLYRYYHKSTHQSSVKQCRYSLVISKHRRQESELYPNYSSKIQNNMIILIAFIANQGRIFPKIQPTNICRIELAQNK